MLSQEIYLEIYILVLGFVNCFFLKKEITTVNLKTILPFVMI